MNEKVFKTVSNVAGWNIVLGIAVLVTGLASGVLLLVSAARLFRSTNDLMI